MTYWKLFAVEYRLIYLMLTLPTVPTCTSGRPLAEMNERTVPTKNNWLALLYLDRKFLKNSFLSLTYII